MHFNEFQSICMLNQWGCCLGLLVQLLVKAELLSFHKMMG